MTTLMVNSRQALKFRLLLLFSLICCAGALYAAAGLYETYGLNPGDGGVLRPLSERLAFAGFVAAVGLLFAGGMMLYAGIYVVHMARDGDILIIDTLSPLGIGSRRLEFDTAQISGTSYYHGQMRTPRHNVNAPWHTLRIEGRMLPFVLDAQAEQVNISAINALARRAEKQRGKNG